MWLVSTIVNLFFVTYANDSWLILDSSVPYSVRVDTALKWLNGSAGVYPNLIILYFSKVDEGGHEGGPGSLQVRADYHLYCRGSIFT